MKRFFLIVLASLFFAATTIAFFPTSVKAASTWQQTDSVFIQNTSQGYNVDWTPIVSDYNLLNAIAFENSNTNPGSTCSLDEFTFAMTSGRISVSQYVINGSPSFWGEKSISIHYNKTGPTPSGTTFVASGFIDPPSPATHHASIVYRGDIGLLATCSSSPPDYYPVANSPGNINYNFSVLYSTFPAVYDDGYDGDVVPESPPAAGATYTPEIGYYTDDQNVLHANFIGGSSTTVDGIIPSLKWTVYAPDGTTILDEKVTDIATPYQFRLPGNDTYYFEITYLSPAESAPPGAPFPSLVPFPDGVTIRPIKFVINANGTLIPGSNFLNECSQVGGVLECEAADPLQDCSTFGVDLGGYFQCIFNNFGVWLRNTMIDLFVPSYSFFNPWVENIGNFLNTKLGFVYSSFGFIGGLFNGIITNGASTACIIAPPGTLFDAPFEVDVCKLQEVVGNTVFQLIQGIVISLTILALMFAGYRKYLEVVDHR